jgi:hypothetical protein
MGSKTISEDLLVLRLGIDYKSDLRKDPCAEQEDRTVEKQAYTLDDLLDDYRKDVQEKNKGPVSSGNIGCGDSCRGQGAGSAFSCQDAGLPLAVDAGQEGSSAKDSSTCRVLRSEHLPGDKKKTWLGRMTLQACYVLLPCAVAACVAYHLKDPSYGSPAPSGNTGNVKQEGVSESQHKDSAQYRHRRCVQLGRTGCDSLLKQESASSESGSAIKDRKKKHRKRNSGQRRRKRKASRTPCRPPCIHKGIFYGPGGVTAVMADPKNYVRTDDRISPGGYQHPAPRSAAYRRSGNRLMNKFSREDIRQDQARGYNVLNRSHIQTRYRSPDYRR